MRGSRFTLVSLAVVLLAAMAAVAGLVLATGVDISWSREWLAVRLSRELGRPLTIGGDFSLTLGRVSRLEASQVEVANAAWGTAPNFASVGRILIEVDLWSLIRGPVLVRRLEVNDGRVSLERSADGDGNWPLVETSADGDGLGLLLEEVTVNRGVLSYRTPNLQRPLDFQIATGKQVRQPSGLLKLTVTGTLNERPVDLALETSPARELQIGRDVMFRVSGRLGEVAVRGSALFDDIQALRRPQIDLRLHADEAAAVARTLGLPPSGAGPLELKLALTPESTQVAIALLLQAGEYSLRATGNVDSFDSARGLDLDAVAAGPDFSAVAGLLGWADAPPGPFDVAGTVRSDGNAIDVQRAALTVGGFRFDLNATMDVVPRPELRRVQVSVAGSDLKRFRDLLGIPGIAEGPFKVTADLQENAAGVDLVNVRVEQEIATLRASGRLGPYPEFYGTRLSVNADGRSLRRLGTAVSVPGLPSGPFKLSADLDWSARGLELRAGSLAGGGHTLRLSGKVARQPLGPGTVLDVDISGSNLRDLGPALGQKDLPAVRYRATGRVSRVAGASRLSGVEATLGDGRVKLDGVVGDPPAWHGSALRFELSGKDLARWAAASGRQLPPGPFRAAGEVRVGKEGIRLGQVAVEIAGAKGSVDAHIGRPVRSSRGDFDVKLAGPDLARLLPEFGQVQPVVTGFDFEARGNWRAERWSIEVARLRAGADEISIRGGLGFGGEMAATAMPTSVRIASLARAGALVGVELPDLPLVLDGTVAGTARTFRMDPLTGRLGQDAFRGRLAMQTGGTPDISVKLTAEHLDIGPFIGTDAGPAAAGAPTARASSADRMIPDWPVPVDWMAWSNMEFDLAVKELAVDQVTYGDLDLAGTVRDGSLTVTRWRQAGPAGRIDLQLTLSGRASKPRLTMRGQLRDVVVLYRVVSTTSPDPPRSDVDLHLRAQGSTLRELMGSLDGELRIVGGPGRVTPTAFDAIYGATFADVFRTINPFSRSDPFVNDVCSVAPLMIRRGRISTAPAIIKLTDKLNIITTGTLDLPTERLDLNFRTEARKGIGFNAAELVNPYIKVGGTLTQPRVTLDPKGTMVAGGAAVLTGGLSILATTLWNRAFREKDPCAAALKAADEAARDDGGRQKFVAEVDDAMRAVGLVRPGGL